jgi:hypothetical protein
MASAGRAELRSFLRRLNALRDSLADGGSRTPDRLRAAIDALYAGERREQLARWEIVLTMLGQMARRGDRGNDSRKEAFVDVYWGIKQSKDALADVTRREDALAEVARRINLTLFSLDWLAEELGPDFVEAKDPGWMPDGEDGGAA